MTVTARRRLLIVALLVVVAGTAGLLVFGSRQTAPVSAVRAPRPMVVVEKRALTAYAQLTGGRA